MAIGIEIVLLMVDINAEKEMLINNLKKAVKNCLKLKTRSRLLESSFKIDSVKIDDLTEEQYQDGDHCFNADALVVIKDKKSLDSISRKEKLHFNAQITGTDVKIVDEMISGDNIFIPTDWDI